MNLYKTTKSFFFSFNDILFRKRPAPWAFYKFYQVFLNTFLKNRKNTLRPEVNAIEELFDNNFLKEELKPIIQLEKSNLWTLDYEVLNFLWEEIHINKPKVILEFGSGTSTKMFFEYFRKRIDQKHSLITIDQDKSFLEKTIKDIGEINSNISFHPILCPLIETGYRIDFGYLNDIIKKVGSVDMVLIDGPSGGWMIRENALPSILEFCNKGAKWYLDDAFRDSEMEILRKWKKHPQIKVNGIVNIGKGLGNGDIRNE